MKSNDYYCNNNLLATMNLAGSMRSQDNINKVGHRKER